MNPTIKYPIFEVEENAFLTQKILPVAIPQTDSKYFQANRRCNISEEDIVSKELIDCMGIYEEGDWWCLAVIKINVRDGQFKYLFLPLASGIVKEEFFETHSPLIGITTNSTFYGERHWILYDALEEVRFGDIKFVQKLIDLFFPPNPYMVIQNAELGGKFDFHLIKENNMYETYGNEMFLEWTENNDLSIKYGNTYEIILYRYIQPINAVDLKEKENVIGYITYSSPFLSELLIGVLLKL